MPLLDLSVFYKLVGTNEEITKDEITSFITVLNDQRKLLTKNIQILLKEYLDIIYIKNIELKAPLTYIRTSPKASLK